MYPRNAASPERIAIGAVILIADGTVQTSGVSVTVRGQGGSEGASAGTIAYGASGIVYYTPTQGETDFTSFVLIASKASCIPVAVTIITSASAVAGHAGLDWAKINAPTTTQGLSGTTVKTATDVETDTADIQSRLPAALTGAGNIKADALLLNGATPNNLAATSVVSAGAITTSGGAVSNVTTVATVTGLTASNLDATVSSRAAQTTADAIETDTQDIQTRLPAALVSGRMSSDAVAVSGSTTAADNVEANIANLDATVSSRLPTASYTAPDNAGILAAIAALEDVAVADIFGNTIDGETFADLLRRVRAAVAGESSINKTTGVETLKKADGGALGTRTIDQSTNPATRTEIA